MRLLLPLAILAAVLGVVGCGKGDFSKRANEGKQNIFRYPIPTKPTSLDPAIVQDGDTIDLLQQVYEGLVKWGEDNKPQPNLAESWKVSDDGTTYTFKLKKGVKFFNGREVTAEDFKWSIERACNPKLTQGMARNYLIDIVGVADMLDGKANEVKGVRVVDPGTLEIKIDKPRPYFLGKLTYMVSYVVAKESVPADKEITDIKAMVGTGPFKPKSYENDQLFVLEANKDYHNGAPKIDGIERKVVLDPQTRLNEFKTGNADLVSLERQDVAALQADAQFKDQVKFFPRPSIWYVGMNLKEYPPFADVRVRQAFAMAIDRDRIVNQILGGINKKADTILPPGVIGHRDEATFPAYNPEKAKQLLAEAGYPGGKGLPPLEISFRDGRADIRIVAEAVQNDLKNVLGVNVAPRATEWRAYLEKHNVKKIPFFHMRWAADYLDPQNFLSFLLAGDGPENKTYYANPEFDRLCAQADTTQDEATRLKLYAQAEDICLKECAWIPIYFQMDAELISPRVQGLRESLFGHLPHTTVSLSQ